MRLMFSTRNLDFYLCFGKIYDAQQDDYCRKGLTIRIGKFAYNYGKEIKRVYG